MAADPEKRLPKQSKTSQWSNLPLGQNPSQKKPRKPPTKTKRDQSSKNRVPEIGSTSKTGKTEEAKKTTPPKSIDPIKPHYPVNAFIVSVKELAPDASLKTVKKISKRTETCEVAFIHGRWDGHPRGF